MGKLAGVDAQGQLKWVKNATTCFFALNCVLHKRPFLQKNMVKHTRSTFLLGPPCTDWSPAPSPPKSWQLNDLKSTQGKDLYLSCECKMDKSAQCVDVCSFRCMPIEIVELRYRRQSIIHQFNCQLKLRFLQSRENHNLNTCWSIHTFIHAYPLSLPTSSPCPTSLPALAQLLPVTSLLHMAISKLPLN